MVSVMNALRLLTPTALRWSTLSLRLRRKEGNFCYGLSTMDYGLPPLPLTLKKLPYQLGAFVFFDAAGDDGFGVGYLLV